MSALTALKLNEQIVLMRKSVEKARVRLCRQLIRRLKMLQKSKVADKKTRKVPRIVDEISLCKKMPRDDVSKFALVNVKELRTLLNKGEISASERVLYKLALQETVTRSVNEFRTKYPNWKHEVPFLLQRLGLQYKSKKKVKETIQKLDETKVVHDKNTGREDLNNQDVTTLVKKEIKKAVRKEEKLDKKKKLGGKAKSKNELTEQIAPIFDLPKPELPEPIITRGQGVITILHLDGNSDSVFPTTSARNEVNDGEVGKQNACAEASSVVGGESDTVKETISSVKTEPVRKRSENSNREEKEIRMGPKRHKKSEDLKSFEEVPKTKSEVLESEKLHPSWIAKKLEREALKKLQATIKPKKIVFDSD